VAGCHGRLFGGKIFDSIFRKFDFKGQIGRGLAQIFWPRKRAQNNGGKADGFVSWGPSKALSPQSTAISNERNLGSYLSPCRIWG